MKGKYFVPLLCFLVPTIIGSIVLWPESITGVFFVGGYIVMLISVVIIYVAGIRMVLRDRSSSSD